MISLPTVNPRHLLGLGLLLGTVLLLAGCPRATERGRLEELFISNRRFNMDEDRGIARLYGRLDNTGDARFRRVEVHAVLRAQNGDKRGENSVSLEHIKPHERRVFALTVTSHGRVADVELELQLPENP